jgi:hypothetical protein
VPLAIPGKIEAEHFDLGGEGVAYHDLRVGNDGGQYRATDVDIEKCWDAGGGYDVGWIDAAEWSEYTVNVARTGTYTVEARVARDGPGGTFHLEFNGLNKTGLFTIPNTGGWQNWRTVRKSGVSLTAGTQAMRIFYDSSPAWGGGNLNYLNVLSNTAPVVNLTDPPTGLVLTQADVLILTSAATDIDGDVSKVEYFAGTTKLGQATAAPYQLTWTNMTNGAYCLTAKATDNGGLEALSPPVTVTVDVTRPPLSVRLGLPFLANGQWGLVLIGEHDRTYRIDVSSNLVAWRVLTNLVKGSASNLVADPTATMFPCRFYRAMTQ